MRDGDFSDPPIVTEYGMQTGELLRGHQRLGIAGCATRGTDDPAELGIRCTYGPIEMLASAYGETAGCGDTGGVDPDSCGATCRTTLTKQAQRNIAHRWPTPLVVRVPDNSTLNPEGATSGSSSWSPACGFRCAPTGTCREVAQWQKLDSVTVTEDDSGGGEDQRGDVPGPEHGGDDPDPRRRQWR